jgi:CRP-like cAMP-binding protein
MNDIQILQNTELFQGLKEDDLRQINAICRSRSLKRGELFITQGSPGDSLGIIKMGLMAIEVTRPPKKTPQEIVHLGEGQILGEMSLVDHGPRSATARVLQTPTEILVIQHDDFHQLCEQNYRIGYIVLKNLAADLSFKLRQRSLE